jgi:predicted transcriptional regulator
MANLTVSIDDELLQKAREVAVRERTSVNALVRDYLVRYVGSKSQQRAAIRQLDKLASTSRSKLSSSYTRDELHVRTKS